jgi:hypothetical protein
MMFARHCHFRGVWHFGQDGLVERPKFKPTLALLNRVDMANLADTLAICAALPQEQRNRSRIVAGMAF